MFNRTLAVLKNLRKYFLVFNIFQGMCRNFYSICEDAFLRKSFRRSLFSQKLHHRSLMRSYTHSSIARSIYTLGLFFHSKVFAKHFAWRKPIKFQVMSIYCGIYCKNVNPFQANAVFLYPWKHQKASGFLIFPRGIAREHWPKMG